MDREAWWATDHGVAESDMTGDWACKPFKIQSNFNKTMRVYRKHLFHTWQWKVSPPFHLHHHHPVSRFLFSEATTPLFSCIFFHWYLQTYTQQDIYISPFYSESSYTLFCILLFWFIGSGSVILSVTNHSLTNLLLMDTFRLGSVSWLQADSSPTGN